MTEIYLGQGKLEVARQQAKEALSGAEEARWKPSIVSTLELKLRILLQRDEPEDMMELADEALRMAEEMSYLPMLWRLRAARAKLGEVAAAAQEYQAAAKVIQTLMDSIGDGELKHAFLAKPDVASILAALDRSPVNEGA
jgi:tetratricopeptide (TPR) repeat protein